ncbi:AI-2E family transporter [Candidatus Shapirobacteria bacterium]|nr:AI-2E family transporter [Candidatus Shapirobacteria bacterium]
MPKEEKDLFLKHLLTALLVLAGLAFLYLIRDVLLMVLVGFILMLVLNPAVSWLEKWHIPRLMGTVLVYLLVLSIISLLGFGLVPPLINETSLLLDSLKSGDNFNWQWLFPQGNQGLFSDNVSWQNIGSFLGSLSGGILKTTRGVVTSASALIFTSIIGFYLLLERKKLFGYLAPLLGEEKAKKAEELTVEIEGELANWLRAELILMLVVGLMVYFGLLVLGVKYALPLAFLAGILEILPNIGPVLAAAPGVILALIISPSRAFLVILFYFLVQQIENAFIVPKVMQKATGINSLAVLIGILIGARLAGIGGAILVLPLTLVVKVIWAELRQIPELLEK